MKMLLFVFVYGTTESKEIQLGFGLYNGHLLNVRVLRVGITGVLRVGITS